MGFHLGQLLADSKANISETDFALVLDISHQYGPLFAYRISDGVLYISEDAKSQNCSAPPRHIALLDKLSGSNLRVDDNFERWRPNQHDFDEVRFDRSAAEVAFHKKSGDDRVSIWLPALYDFAALCFH